MRKTLAMYVTLHLNLKKAEGMVGLCCHALPRAGVEIGDHPFIVAMLRHLITHHDSCIQH